MHVSLRERPEDEILRFPTRQTRPKEGHLCSKDCVLQRADDLQTFQPQQQIPTMLETEGLRWSQKQRAY